MRGCGAIHSSSFTAYRLLCVAALLALTSALLEFGPSRTGVAGVGFAVPVLALCPEWTSAAIRSTLSVHAACELVAWVKRSRQPPCGAFGRIVALGLATSALFWGSVLVCGVWALVEPGGSMATSTSV